MKKKRRPKDIIEESNTNVEGGYAKFLGGEIVPVKSEKREHEVTFDLDDLRRLWKQHGKRDYATIHTHHYNPDKENIDEEFSSFPTEKDLYSFLFNDREKSLVIAQQDSRNRRIFGYFVLRKTRKTPSYGYSPVTFLETIARKLGLGGVEVTDEEARAIRLYAIKLSHADFNNNLQEAEKALKNLANYFHLNYRRIRAKDYHLRARTSESRKELSDKLVSGITILFLLTSILFSSQEFTGFAIGNLSQGASNIIGVVLFLVGIIGTFLYFRKKS